MARILVVTQGALAEDLALGAHKISGTANRIETVSLGWDEGPSESSSKVAAAIEKIGGGETAEDGVLILTDLPGGTPFNIAKRFAEPGRIEVMSGVNLSMLVRLCCPGCRERSVRELADWLAEKGRQSISRYQPRPPHETDS